MLAKISFNNMRTNVAIFELILPRTKRAFFFSWIKQNVLLRMCLKDINVWIFYPLVHRLEPKMRMFTCYVLAGKRDVKFGNLLRIKIVLKR